MQLSKAGEGENLKKNRLYWGSADAPRGSKRNKGKSGHGKHSNWATGNGGPNLKKNRQTRGKKKNSGGKKGGNLPGEPGRKKVIKRLG